LVCRLGGRLRPSFGLLAVGSLAGWMFLSKPKGPDETRPASAQADVTLRFVYPTGPALMLINQSEKVAQYIKWTVVIWNLDDPKGFSSGPHPADIHEPFQIPISIVDFLRPGASTIQNLFSSPLVTPHIKDGNRLFGSASVVCPDCARGHTFIVYIVW
jgi:hypothetical protein